MQVKHKEGLIIALAWVLIFASTPLYMYYAMVSVQQDFDYSEVWSMWSYLSAFLLLFLLHHFVLIPQLIGKKRIWQYVVSVVILLVLFVTFLRVMSPIRHHGPLERTMNEEVPERRLPPPDEDSRRNNPPFQPFLLAPPDLARLVISLLMLGVDLGVVAWFNEQKMRQRLLLLEQQNLKQELEHLRYQINPHFFMNTLNNIHVLVDLDQERAQRAIVELSGMMRYALYEGNGSHVPLCHEVEFLNHYISLMKMRFNDKFEVTCDLQEAIPSDVQILPLLLPTFVENAFKHGISYMDHSFIRVQLTVEQEKHQICFTCVNSRHSRHATEDGHHGIGLENVKKRLELQYGDSYSLTIDDQNQSQFFVQLVLPIL